MQLRLNGVWLTMIIAAGVFGLLYLWFSLFPGQYDPETLKYFSLEQINQGRRYSRLLRLLYISSFGLYTTALCWLVFSGKAAALSRWALAVAGNYWGGVLLYSWLIWVGLTLLQLPFAFLSGFYWQRRFGFSTQTMGSWWLDYLKSSVIELLLFSAGVLVLFYLCAHFTKTWWLIGAVLFSLWLVVQMYLWPLLVAPLFNRFTPAEDPQVVSMVRELAMEADIPIEQVLVMDASRRTTKANAYFTGLGRTKRIVLYDTLLRDYSPEEVRAVVAHEMAHWRQGHIVRGLLLGILGTFLLFGILYVLLGQTMLPGSYKSPQFLPAVLLFFALVSFVSGPLQNGISRGMEKEADRVAVRLTNDEESAIRLQINLAQKNMSDVAPAPFIQWFSYTHPAALDRIANIRQALK